MYSQNQEEKYILDYFKDQKVGQVLDIGANDGITFSNSLALIEKGWHAVLVEPSPDCCEKLHLLHKTNSVAILKAAIGKVSGTFDFNESGQLNDPALNGKENLSLVSTLVPEEKKRWNKLNMTWKEYPVNVLCWKDFRKVVPDKFDFITIDAEGVDWEILQQIDLKETGTKLVCIEHNGNGEMSKQIIKYCCDFGLNKLIYFTGENILLGL